MDALRRHRRPVTAASLAEELAVSLRTIYRDVQVLIGLGAPIDGEGRARLPAAAGLLPAAADVRRG